MPSRGPRAPPRQSVREHGRSKPGVGRVGDGRWRLDHERADWIEEVLGNPDDAESLKPRSDYTASEDDNSLVQGIKGENNSWGYFGFAYFNENSGVLKAVKVAGEDGTCVEPSNETVKSGDYVLSRPLFIYVENSALARPEVQKFVRFYLETTPDLITDVGYTPAPAKDYEKGLEALEAAT